MSLVLEIRDGMQTRRRRRTTVLVCFILLVAFLGILQNDPSTWMSPFPSSEQQKRNHHHQPREQNLRRVPSLCTKSTLQINWNAYRSINQSIPILYQCRGRVYDEFATALHRRLVSDILNGTRPRTWGRRLYPLPANRTLLVWGNSHSRQVATTLACQHQDKLVDVQQHAVWEDRVQRFAFANGSVLWVVVNSHIPYFPDWKDSLQQTLGVASLAEGVAVIVMGIWNPCDWARHNGKAIHAVQAENRSLDSCRDESLPNVADLSKVYPGPIVFQPMFTTHSMFDDIHNQSRVALQNLPPPRQEGNHTLYVSTRRVIDAMQHEGIAYYKDDMGPCSRTSNPRYPYTHRCTGPLGGHADPVAWDWTEFFYNELEHGADSSWKIQ